MKRFLITILCCLAVVSSGLADPPATGPDVDEMIRTLYGQDGEKPAGQSLDRLWDAANTAYINARYEEAIALYDSILATGNTGYKLYYNLGNAWFKENRIGRAILYYNKALKLRPSDPDIDHNLKVANTYVKDKIERVPEFFLTRWMREIRMSFNSNTWAVLSLVFFGVALSGVLVYLLAQRIPIRKAGFFTAIAALILFVFAVVSGSIERRELTDGSEAIVMSSAAAVKSSPDSGSKDIFVLHEGTKVKILRSLDAWREISIADGNKGWMQENTIEPIN